LRATSTPLSLGPDCQTTSAHPPHSLGRARSYSRTPQLTGPSPFPPSSLLRRGTLDPRDPGLREVGLQRRPVQVQRQHERHGLWPWDGINPPQPLNISPPLTDPLPPNPQKYMYLAILTKKDFPKKEFAKIKQKIVRGDIFRRGH